MGANELKQQEKITRMTTAPLRPLIVRLAIPTMISMLVTTLYNLVDTYFVGQLKDVRATAAVTVAYALMNIIQATGFFFGQGSGNYISRTMGKGDVERCRRMAATGFFGAVCAGFLLLLFGTIFLRPLAMLCGSAGDETSLSFAADYMRVILLGAPVMCGSIVLNNQLRFQGNATFAMIGLASGAVINVALDALLVPRLQVTGAALATVICQCVSFAVLLVCSRFFSDNINFSIRDVTFRAEYLFEIFRGGFPSLCRQGVASLMNVSLMHCCNIVAAEADPNMIQAAFGIVSKVMMFTASMMIGFGQGFQPVCGFNYGAGKYDRVKRAYFFCVAVSLVFLSAMAITFFFAGRSILSFIQASGSDGKGEQTVALAVRILRWQLLSLPLSSFIVMSNMMLQTTGNVVGASVLAMSRQGLALIPAMFVLSLAFGSEGLIRAQPIADLAAFLISIPFVLRLMKKMKREEEKKRASLDGGGNV